MSIASSREPRVLIEREGWAIVFKPHGMPTAPLKEGEEGTLLAWFLSRYPDADAVLGIKAVERGLLHRLDTDTEGVVLVAKTQAAFDALARSQCAGLLEKRYAAFSSRVAHTVWGGAMARPIGEWTEGTGLPDVLTLPYAIRSRFKAYGPKGAMVRPVFPDMRGYAGAGTDYETSVERVYRAAERDAYVVVVSLVKGFRHQVRAHLAASGLPIVGDPLYGPAGNAWAGKDCADETSVCLPLQLHAISISFPDPADGKLVSFSLPIPDRMTR